MKNPTIKNILTSAGYKHLPWAEKQLAALELRREITGAAFLKDKYKIGGVWILLHAMIGFNKIIMWGGTVFPQILLTDYESAWHYDWYKDAIGNAVLSPDNTSSSDILSPIYNGRSQLAEITHITLDKSWKSELIGNSPALFLGGINDYEMAIFHQGSKIYGRVGSDIGYIGDAQDTFLPQLAKPYGNLFGLPAYKAGTEPYNLWQGLILYTISPRSKSIQDSWYWIPSFFTIFPGEDLTSSFDLTFAGNWAALGDISFSGTSSGLQPGWYYGVKPNPKYFHGDPLESMDVSLMGVLDTRYRSSAGLYQYGWAEFVTNVDGVPVADIYFYFQQSMLTVPYSTLGYRERAFGLLTGAGITMGSELGGNNADYMLALDATWIKPTLDMWNFKIWTKEESDLGLPENDTGVCFALIEGSHAKFIRWSGYALDVFETEKYHSHSTSRDGGILAVFETEDGNLITRINAFDLYGEREVKPDAPYTKGGMTVLSASDVAVPLETKTACIIPYRPKGFTDETRSTLEYHLPSAIPIAPAIIDITDVFSPLATMSFTADGMGGISISKVICDNGIDAKFIRWGDECMGGVEIPVNDPLVATQEERLLAEWNQGGNTRGWVAGSFSESGGVLSFQGERVTALNEWYGIDGVIKLPPDLWFMVFGDFRVQVQDAVGEVSYGNCIKEVGGSHYVDTECYGECGGGFSISATTSCGQSGSREFPDESEPEPLTINYEEVPYDPLGYWTDRDSAPPSYGVGDCFTSSGGRGEISWSATGGIVMSGGCITYVPYPTPCTTTITVSDSCGGSDSITVDIAGGHWVSVDTTQWRYGNCYDEDSTYCKDRGGCVCPTSPSVTYYCVPTDEWPYQPNQELPLSEAPYMLNGSCPDVCYFIYGMTYVHSKGAFSKKRGTMNIGTCPGTGSPMAYYSEVSYVWSC